MNTRTNLRFAIVALASLIVMTLVTAHAHAALQGWWEFDTPADSSGNGNNGTLNGGATLVAGGSPAGGGALRLPGNSGDHFQIPASPTLDSPNFTLAYFLDQNGTLEPGGAFERITSRQGDTFETAINTGGTLSWFTPANGWNGTGQNVPASGWHHVAWRANGGTLDLFINGTPTNLTGGLNVAPSGFMRLGERWTGGEPIEGLLDDVGLWDQPLSDTDIQTIAAVGIDGFLNPAGPAVPEPNTLVLGLLSLASFGLLGWRRRSRR